MGEDSLYADDGTGPYCDECWDKRNNPKPEQPKPMTVEAFDFLRSTFELPDDDAAEIRAALADREGLKAEVAAWRTLHGVTGSLRAVVAKNAEMKRELETMRVNQETINTSIMSTQIWMDLEEERDNLKRELEEAKRRAAEAEELREAVEDLLAGALKMWDDHDMESSLLVPLSVWDAFLEAVRRAREQEGAE